MPNRKWVFCFWALGNLIILIELNLGNCCLLSSCSCSRQQLFLAQRVEGDERENVLSVWVSEWVSAERELSGRKLPFSSVCSLEQLIGEKWERREQCCCLFVCLSSSCLPHPLPTTNACAPFVVDQMEFDWGSSFWFLINLLIAHCLNFFFS